MMSHPHAVTACLTGGLKGGKSNELHGLRTRLLSGHGEAPEADSDNVGACSYRNWDARLLGKPLLIRGSPAF